MLPSSFFMRALSCLVLFPIGAFFIFCPLSWVAAPLLLVAVWTIGEWIRLVGIKGVGSQVFFLGVVVGAMVACLYEKTAGGFAGLLFLAVGYYYTRVWSRMMRGSPTQQSQGPLIQGSTVLLGILYLGVPFLSFITLRQSESSTSYLFWVLCIIWTTDVVAYSVGSLVKGPKLCPRLSPSKTWSGLMGGVGTATFVSWGLGTVLLESSPLFLVSWGMGFSLLAVSGDLLESALKRFFFKKDAGSLIPGHGGLLDRLDSALVVIPVATLLFYWRDGLFARILGS